MREAAKKVLLAVLWSCMGRRNLVRLARFLSNSARLDVPNEMSQNGELVVQDIALGNSDPSGPLIVFDVGANVGDWTRHLVTKGRARHADIRVHAFEPCQTTFKMLGDNLRPFISDGTVQTNNLALSNTSGTATLYVVGNGAGTNSLHRQEPLSGIRTETTGVTSLCEYCSARNIRRVHLLKIDTEGHDMAVLEGAADMLKQGRIDLIQFEYNHRWIYSRHYLRDAFELLLPLGYLVGKVTPKGIEFYSQWEPELESFREGNYLSCQKAMAQKFPRVKYWNEA